MRPARFARSLRSFFISLFPAPAPSSRQPFGGKSQSHLIAGFARTVRGLRLGGPMRVVLLVLSAVLSALFLDSSAAQQTASSSTQASQLMQQSLAALQGNTSISDITLTGTARRIAGSGDETGTGLFKAARRSSESHFDHTGWNLVRSRPHLPPDCLPQSSSRACLVFSRLRHRSQTLGLRFLRYLCRPRDAQRPCGRTCLRLANIFLQVCVWRPSAPASKSS